MGAYRLSVLSSSGALRGFGCGLLLRFFEAVNIIEVAPELAHHFEHFGDWLRAIKYLMLAVDSAGRRFGPSRRDSQARARVSMADGDIPGSSARMHAARSRAATPLAACSATD